jgi:hypothetical protein
MFRSSWGLLLALVIVLTSKLTSAVVAEESPGAVIVSEFLFDTAPFASCHASTIAMSRTGLVAA